ncbi:receiver/sensor box histidine kinase [Halobacterium hubeiense]|uniref:histidine kinase n=1 Tax=Halobacterium hubeiense TaxID=1407499 RepID=A0A0U5H579_9EURY|nr:PAS domain-containing protein [Halobacterium hubeiense]CQH56616.1 receiver/sensor box histidine kinase [Halobacterium hubeiense]
MDGAIRVLHVDDEPGFAEMTGEFLERADGQFVVETAARTAAALDALAARDYDCVVSDYDLPEQNGIEFLEAVREDYPDLPFILFTGKGSEEVASDAISAGVTDYLQKQSGTDHYELLANRIANAVGQRETERDAEDTEQQLAELAAHTHDVLWTFSADWEELLFVNDAYEDIWGRSVESLEDDPRSFLDGVHPEDRERVEAAMDELAAGEHLDVEYRVNEAEDYGRWVWARGEPVADDDGNVVRVTGFSRDVTERKARERELHDRERQYRAIFEDPNILVGLLDTDGTVRDINQTAFEYVNSDVESVTGEPFWETPWFAHSADARASVAEWVERAADGEYVEFQLDLVDGDGEPYAVEGVFRPVTDDDGDVVSIVVSDREVTDRKRRERRLRALSETTRSLLAADSREAVAETAVAATRDILGLNANAIHLYDSEQNALVPAAISDAARDIIDEPPTFRPGSSIAWRVFEDGEPLALDDVHSDADVYRPDSPVRSEIFLPLGDHGILLVGSPSPSAFDEHDIALGEVFAENVVTALEQVERTAELRVRERELSAQNERLSEFASVVSHDLRNPLNVAEGRLELARETGDDRHFEEVTAAHERMQALIDDLLALTREGSGVGDVTTIGLRSLVEDCWATVDTGNATLAGDAAASIRGDESRVRQLFENLFRNAVEHGSIDPQSASRSEDAVEHSAANPRSAAREDGGDVTVTVGLLDDGSGFYVEDDGPGVPEGDREKVFEYGYSTVDDGTGFGLNIVQQVAEAHGWTVRVTDGEAGGARFEVTGVEVVEPQSTQE